MEHAGFDVVCGVEWDLHAAMTYLFNLGHPDCRIAFDDAKTEAKWNQLHAKRLKKWKRGDMPKKKWIGKAYRETVRRCGREGMTASAANDYVRELNDPKDYNPDGGALGFYIGDIKKTNGQALLELAGVDRFDVIVGGPPCQGLSSANSRACIEDPRNGLLWEYLRIVEETKPQAFIIENVPQLLTVAKGGLFNALCKRANKAGYDVVAQKINAAWYGVPQNRVRALLIGQREGAPAFQFPMPQTWGLGRSANGKSWTMLDHGDEIEESLPEVEFDSDTGTFRFDSEAEAIRAARAVAPTSQSDLFGEDIRL
jgi:site-specific DNA-cytosine methylase